MIEERISKQELEKTDTMDLMQQTFKEKEKFNIDDLIFLSKLSSKELEEYLGKKLDVIKQIWKLIDDSLEVKNPSNRTEYLNKLKDKNDGKTIK